MRGVLFDFDGTLADTMELHYEAWRSALARRGFVIDKRQYMLREGDKAHEIAARYAKSGIDEIVRDKRESFVLNKVSLFPGVEEVLDSLMCPIGIVTASSMNTLRAVVPDGFLERFDVLITLDDCVNGKPHPEPYMRGAAALGVDCIAVENSPFGVMSAKSAGLYCIGVCSTVGRDDLSEADEVVDRFSDLMGVIHARI